MRSDQPLPHIWLISDARNDAVLERALHDLPRGSGFVFRHYHLDGAARRERFGVLQALCRKFGHLCVLSADADTAAAWGADGIYGPPLKLAKRPGLLRFATVHDVEEVTISNQIGVDAMFLSPVYPTRSHSGGGGLGKQNFLALAARAERPVIALGGMTAARAAELGWPRWAAIDAFLR